MFGLPGLSGLLGLANRASTQLEYWKEYKGERILIRSPSIENNFDGESNGGPYQYTSYVIDGEIEDVMSFPPGFRLVDVTEYLYESFYTSMAVKERQEVLNHATHYNVQNLREIDRKFVSFDAIEHIEWAEDADRVIEPLRKNSVPNPERDPE